MEFCEIGDLNKYCIDACDIIMAQITSGISCLHDKDVIHRDIKPGNILVASEGPLIVKLTDFDVTKCLDLDFETLMSSNVGTNAFKAPEFFMRNKQKKLSYHRSVDIYAAGLTFLTMIQHTKASSMLIPRIETLQDDSELYLPIGQLNAERIKYKVKELSVVSFNESASGFSGTTEIAVMLDPWTKEMKKLIQKMTYHDPEERPAACDVMAALRPVNVSEYKLKRCF